MSLSPADLAHLTRAVDLAEEALDAGDDPFGSLLVDAFGAVRREERNHVGGGDATRHPEFELARWAAGALTPTRRAAARTVTDAVPPWRARVKPAATSAGARLPWWYDMLTS